MKLSGFTFDDVCITPDRQIGEHSHPRWEVSYIICGGGTRTIGDKTESIREGEIILLPPDISHVWHFNPEMTDSEGNIRNISVFFPPSLIDGMLALFPEITRTLASLKSQTEAISYSGKPYTRIRDLLLSMRGLSPSERLPLMIKLICALSEAEDSRTVGKRSILDRIGQRCEKIRIYCACNYARDITLEEMARHIGMNKSAFCTFMRARFGMSLSQYVNAFRLERAKEKLLSCPDRSISGTALDCGFTNVTYFNRLFKAHFGMSPKSVRNQ